jgi:hypothetical protein
MVHHHSAAASETLDHLQLLLLGLLDIDEFLHPPASTTSSLMQRSPYAAVRSLDLLDTKL